MQPGGGRLRGSMKRRPFCARREREERSGEGGGGSRPVSGEGGLYRAAEGGRQVATRQRGDKGIAEERRGWPEKKGGAERGGGGLCTP